MRSGGTPHSAATSSGAIGAVREARVRAESPDRAPDELEEVLVSRDDPAFPALGAAAGRGGGDQIVRLPALGAKHGHVERTEHFLDEGDLGMEIFRGLLPGGLVFGVHIVAESLGSGIEYRGEGSRIPLVEEGEEETEKTEGRRDVGAGRIAKRTVHQGEIGTIDDRVGIEEVERTFHA